ncbi:MAG: hypothetical protein KC925_02380 [Candidatus Doudnabacteria bacterium]|nr:hypothetical protein [Candidatus Doudnabacteria bacterium]MCA9387722.1 hypothetical protein [Candidatus Andersenbacteria bacterium]
METFHSILLFLHLLGFAAILGGMFVQLKGDRIRQVNPAMFYGALVQGFTGLLLTWQLGAQAAYLPVALKTVLLIVILAIFFGYRKREMGAKIFWLSFVLVLTEVLLAVFSV